MRAEGWLGAIVVGVLTAAWLLAHPESPVLLVVGLVIAAGFVLLALVSTVQWAVRKLRAGP